MDNTKEKVLLNDELLDKVVGGCIEAENFQYTPKEKESREPFAPDHKNKPRNLLCDRGTVLLSPGAGAAPAE